ncbi:MAG: hypothetical protein CFE49_00195 [Pseudomonas sp. PGPPP3]|nr:MAG: hypothetical protein CFE49_00195 [Pseudomonas sp. PGPPP3]
MAFKNPFSRAMPPDRATRWEMSRQRGRWGFALLSGVVGWGIPMTIGMSLFLHGRHSEPQFWLQVVPFNLGLYSLGGLLHGLWMWRLNERAYLKFKKETEERLPPSDS